MPQYPPLTLCPPARINLDHKSAPEAVDFGDIYFSTDGGPEDISVRMAAPKRPERCFWALAASRSGGRTVIILPLENWVLEQA